MRRVNLDLITFPMITQQPKVTDKVPPRVAKLAELRRMLQKRVAQLDAPVSRAEDEQARERARNMELDRSVWGGGAERKWGHVHGALRSVSPASCTRRGTYELDVDGPVVRGERDGRAPGFASLRTE